MNRVSRRSMIVLILSLVLAVGTMFFVGEFAVNGNGWVMFAGSPHIYRSSEVHHNVITDTEGRLLMKNAAGEKTYCGDALVRKATLHWVGDREGMISVPALSHYAEELTGYDLLNGVYSYGGGGELRLSIHADVQKAALEAMGDRVGTVVVYNYKTGELLCAVTTPTYDPDDVPDIEGDTTGAYAGAYLKRFQRTFTPGSIFKVVTLAAALECIPEVENQSFSCAGSYDTGEGVITCESRHGKQSLQTAFTNSCNCAFAQLAAQIGPERMTQYVKQFGITEPVSFDGTTTAAGNYDVGTASAGQFAWSAIGQHTDLVNPCRFMTFLGAIAGGGTGAKPYVVSKVKVDGAEPYTAKTEKTERIMSVSTAERLQSYLAANVENKYGAENFPGLTVCAKTGTGEVGGDRKPNAMFAGFVADEEYPLAFLVAVEDGGYGAKVCVPIASRVLGACKAAMDN